MKTMLMTYILQMAITTGLWFFRNMKFICAWYQRAFPDHIKCVSWVITLYLINRKVTQLLFTHNVQAILFFVSGKLGVLLANSIIQLDLTWFTILIFMEHNGHSWVHILEMRHCSLTGREINLELFNIFQDIWQPKFSWFHWCKHSI